MRNPIRKIRIQLLVASIVLAVVTDLETTCLAENPIIQTKFTADPDPVVYNDRVYLFTSHDEDDVRGHTFKMKNWMVYTTTDLANWTDHGIVAGIEEPYNTFSWVDRNSDSAWAPKAITRNGKWYLYGCFVYKGHLCIGVAVADNPFGPYVDPLGKPLIYGNTPANDYDPAPIIDDDGQAYLYWGGGGATVPGCYYVKLNEDMISTSGGIVNVAKQIKTYEEGPDPWKHNGKYYLGWATTCCPEGVGYAMSDGPTGPWTYKGYIMDPSQQSSGNSCGYMDYKGKSYVFGFNYALNWELTDVHRERRSICVSEVHYNPDGTIQKAPWFTEEGVAQVGAFNPYAQVDAATICHERGIKTKPRSGDRQGVYVNATENGAYIKVQGVDFGDQGAARFLASVAAVADGNTLTLRLDSEVGTAIGTLKVKSTGALDKWETQSCNIRGAKCVHDLYLTFFGSGVPLMNVDWWKFEN